MENEMELNAKTLTISGVFHLVFGAFSGETVMRYSSFQPHLKKNI
jgi:hypothetical protein